MDANYSEYTSNFEHTVKIAEIILRAAADVVGGYEGRVTTPSHSAAQVGLSLTSAARDLLLAASRAEILRAVDGATAAVRDARDWGEPKAEAQLQRALMLLEHLM